MTDTPQPEWMKGHAPSPVRGNPAWKPGVSGNPAGRPKGIQDRRQKLQSAFADDGVAIAKVVVAAALEGDLQACAIALSRIAPALRSQTERVQFEFDADASQTQQIAQVLAAIAAGTVAPDVGKQIIDALGTLSAARATEELEARLAALEAKAA
jgi:hypothetical protein